MTLPQIEAIEKAYGAEVQPVCALAKEALELREALEWMWARPENHMMHMEIINGRYRYTISGVVEEGSVTIEHVLAVGEGSTPLEAIQKARGK